MATRGFNGASLRSSIFDVLSQRLLPLPASDDSQAAVILLISREYSPALLYTRRAIHLRSHPGEICFPGGRRDAEDIDLCATALREMEEEIGVPGSAVKVLGCLPEARTRAGISVTPVVASISTDHPLILSPSELDAAFWVPLAQFDRGLKVRDDLFVRSGSTYTVPVYHYQGYEIWGMTAYITAQLLKLISQD